MRPTVELRLEPNDKYARVIGLWEPSTEASDPDGDAGEDEAAERSWSDDYEDWPEEHQEAADDYVELVADAPEPADYGIDEDELDPLSWDDISPASDPDLLAKIATYFRGMSPTEPADQLRAKCRLLAADVYANAQVAAKEELRSAAEA
jgi:hypothetical protein